MRGFFTWRAFGTADGWEAAPASAADGAPVTQYTGPVVEAAAPFVQAVPSWCAHTPPGSWIELQVRARMGALDELLPGGALGCRARKQRPHQP
ncbi:MAG: hypothetical protein U0074_22385 [Kouleothrix sp.]